MMGWGSKNRVHKRLERKRKARVVRLLQINGLADCEKELFTTVRGWNRRRHTANSMRFE
jgi:hypothetical protein